MKSLNLVMPLMLTLLAASPLALASAPENAAEEPTLAKCVFTESEGGNFSAAILGDLLSLNAFRSVSTVMVDDGGTKIDVMVSKLPTRQITVYGKRTIRPGVSEVVSGISTGLTLAVSIRTFADQHPGVALSESKGSCTLDRQIIFTP